MLAALPLMVVAPADPTIEHPDNYPDTIQFKPDSATNESWLPNPLDKNYGQNHYFKLHYQFEASVPVVDQEKYVRDFFNSQRSVIMDQSKCLYYTYFGSDTRDNSAFPPRQCDIWPPKITAAMNLVEKMEHMEVYLSKDKIGVNRVDMYDKNNLYGFQETCVKTQADLTPSESPGYLKIENKRMFFHWALADDYTTDADLWWMLKMVSKENGDNVADNVQFGTHPYHIGYIKLEMKHDPNKLFLMGFQAATDHNFPDRGASKIGFYYQLKASECSKNAYCAVPLLTAALTKTVVTTTETSYTLNFALDPDAAICIFTDPKTFSVTHDSAAESDVTISLT